jgi:hypothetical protein
MHVVKSPQPHHAVSFQAEVRFAVLKIFLCLSLLSFSAFCNSKTVIHGTSFGREKSERTKDPSSDNVLLDAIKSGDENLVRELLRPGRASPRAKRPRRTDCSPPSGVQRS